MTLLSYAIAVKKELGVERISGFAAEMVRACSTQSEITPRVCADAIREYKEQYQDNPNKTHTWKYYFYSNNAEMNEQSGYTEE